MIKQTNEQAKQRQEKQNNQPSSQPALTQHKQSAPIKLGDKQQVVFTKLMELINNYNSFLRRPMSRH